MSVSMVYPASQPWFMALLIILFFTDALGSCVDIGIRDYLCCLIEIAHILSIKSIRIFLPEDVPCSIDISIDDTSSVCFV